MSHSNAIKFLLFISVIVIAVIVLHLFWKESVAFAEMRGELRGGGDVRMATIVEKQDGQSFSGMFQGQCFHDENAVYCATELDRENPSSKRTPGMEP